MNSAIIKRRWCDLTPAAVATSAEVDVVTNININNIDGRVRECVCVTLSMTSAERRRWGAHYTSSAVPACGATT